MNISKPLVYLLLTAGLLQSVPLSSIAQNNNIQDSFNRLGDSIIDAMDRAKADREAREQRRQEFQERLEQERQAREEKRAAEQAARAEQLREWQAEQARIAAEKAAQKLEADRIALDQNLGALSLQVGDGTASRPVTVSPAPESIRRANPPAENLSTDPMLLSRLNQVAEQVRAGNYAQARKLANTCATLFPDDPRPKSAIQKINVLDPQPPAPGAGR
jgi:hypothetical protein